MLLEQVGAARASVRNAAVIGLRKLARSECASLWPAGAAHRLALEAISLTDTDPATLARCLGVIEVRLVIHFIHVILFVMLHVCFSC